MGLNVILKKKFHFDVQARAWMTWHRNAALPSYLYFFPFANFCANVSMQLYAPASTHRASAMVLMRRQYNIIFMHGKHLMPILESLPFSPKSFRPRKFWCLGPRPEGNPPPVASGLWRSGLEFRSIFFRPIYDVQARKWKTSTPSKSKDAKARGIPVG